jgi:RND family efflux transporter MFP subunit
VVVWRDANTGTLLQSGTGSDTQSLPVVTLAQSGLLRLRLPVPEDAVKYVHVGDEMQVRVDAIGRSFTGKVVRFTRNVSLQTRTMQTEIDVENKNLSIDPGMYANTQLQLAHVSNVLTIPVEALILKGNHEVVYVLDGENRIHQRTVQVGLQGSLLAEITSGLQAGDRVILGGQEKFQDGERVQPVFTRPPSIDVTQEQGGEIDLHNEQGSEQ